LACRRELARIGRGSLPRPEGLVTHTRIIEWLVVLPTQSIVEGQISPDFPTILCKQVDRVATHVLTLGRPLQVRVGKSQQIVREQVLVSKRIQRDRVVQTAAEVAVITIGVEEQRLEEALFSEIDAELSS